MGKRIEAEKIFSRAIEAGKNGNVEKEKEYYDELIKKFHSAENMEIKRQVAGVCVNKGTVLLQLGNNRDAVKAYDGVFVAYGEE